jgi:hypothetical protein
MDTPKGEARCKQCGVRLVGVAGEAICGRCASEYKIEFKVRMSSPSGESHKTKARKE